MAHATAAGAASVGRKEERTGACSVLGGAGNGPSAEEMKFSSVAWFSHSVLSAICYPQATHRLGPFPQNKAICFPGVYSLVNVLDPLVLSAVLGQ